MKLLRPSIPVRRKRLRREGPRHYNDWTCCRNEALLVSKTKPASLLCSSPGPPQRAYEIARYGPTSYDAGDAT